MRTDCSRARPLANAYDPGQYVNRKVGESLDWNFYHVNDVTGCVTASSALTTCAK